MAQSPETTTALLDRPDEFIDSQQLEEILEVVPETVQAAESPVEGGRAIYFDDGAILDSISLRRFNVRGAFDPAGTDRIRRQRLGGYVVRQGR